VGSWVWELRGTVPMRLAMVAGARSRWKPLLFGAAAGAAVVGVGFAVAWGGMHGVVQPPWAWLWVTVLAGLTVGAVMTDRWWSLWSTHWLLLVSCMNSHDGPMFEWQSGACLAAAAYAGLCTAVARRYGGSLIATMMGALGGGIAGALGGVLLGVLAVVVLGPMRLKSDAVGGVV